MSEVTIRGLAVAFGSGSERTEVLRDLDLDVIDGHLTAVVGASGCGKTTLLRTIAGFVAPDAGTVSIDGQVVAGRGVHVPPERRGVTLVPQEGALFPHLDVASNVAFGLTRRQPRTRVAELLELVGLAGMETRRPHELSGGQQQRVALARALAPEPRLVLLDEPFSALDAGLRESVRAEVRRVLRRAGTTALLVTHDQDEALSVADSVDPGANGAETVGTVTLRPEQIRILGVDQEGVAGHVEERTYYGHDATVAVRLVGEHGIPGQRVIVRTTGALPPEDEVRLAVTGTGRFFPTTA
jgi:ABC-type Fe3+/spermidine/putrescine transport system ATPase subunit